ncbi:MAG: hypothetical protein LQ338_005031 [Usnochroma carphineum]|nr:MAG: hypothetical protein LQ338_005031 [Usnochroma carphineum]
MAISISSSLLACRTVFNELIQEFQDLGTEKPEGLYIQDWEDEQGRLRMWAANIEAHQTGQSSLDFRLRDSSHIQQQIIKLLDELLQRLQDVRAVLEEGEDQDVESIEDSSSEDEAPQTEIQQLRRNVATIINCLFEMSILVRKPAQHDIRVGSRQADVAAYGWADIRHVRDKFPNVDEMLVVRLGQAITRRRKYLKYRERHAAKLRQGINDGIQDPPRGGSEILSETVATDARNWNVDADDKASSESGFSQTSYALTLMSGGDITIPAPPRASEGGAPFECPYCYFVISVQTRGSWNRHVFNDLQPYICTRIRCTTPDKLYATRHDWLHHLRTEHSNEDTDRRECALCGKPQNNTESHDRHVAGHLQELALFILPRNEEDLNEEGLKQEKSFLERRHRMNEILWLRRDIDRLRAANRELEEKLKEVKTSTKWLKTEESKLELERKESPE